MKILLKIVLLTCVSSLVACSDKEEIIEKYNNGKVKAIYYKQNNLLSGEFKSYYKDGKLKAEHIYKNGVKVDSSVYYYWGKNIENGRRRVVYYSKVEKDSFNLNYYYNKNGYKTTSGYTSHKDIDLRVGKWSFFKQETDSIVEYLNMGGESYVNQVWILNSKTRDTLKNRGNFFEIYMRDTISLGDLLHIRCFLYLPYYGYNSDMEVLIPTDDNELKNDFSNFDTVEKEVFYSLKNDIIQHLSIPKEIPKNHYADFGFQYEDTGEKRIRGAIVEYVDINIKAKNGADSITRLERRLFFDRKVYVKE